VGYLQNNLNRKDHMSSMKVNPFSNVTRMFAKILFLSFVLHPMTTPAGYADKPVPALIKIGDNYRGGNVAYIFKQGDPGYVKGETHGLIAAKNDMTYNAVYGTQTVDINDPSSCTEIIQLGEFRWSTFIRIPETPEKGCKWIGTSTIIGSGKSNTAAILAAYPRTTFKYTAAVMCDKYSVTDGEVTYDNWYLPSKDELSKLYENRIAIGGFADHGYWSSSELKGVIHDGWLQSFRDGKQETCGKNGTFYVRAVRNF